MAEINCPKCKETFDSQNPKSIVTRGAAALAGGGLGAKVGSGLGIVAGPLGGISGLIPGAIIGSAGAYFTADQFRKCPHCNKILKT